MSKKVISAIVLAITVGFVLLVTTMPTKANDVLPENKPFSLELKSKADAVQNWVASRPDAINNFVEESKEYQADQWAKGKEQTANNWKKIKYFFLGAE
jgi:hypothetical protein